MKNFRVSNQMKEDKYNAETEVKIMDADTEYVVEIIDGEMKFRNNSKENQKDCDGAVITFAEPYNDDKQNEQQISISYEYKSDRQRIYNFNRPVSLSGDLRSILSEIEENTELNTEVKVPVNRLGTYQVSVKAYDAYNNIFNAKDDDTFKVCCGIPEMDIILNSEYSNNSEDFFKGNIDGSVYSVDLTRECDSDAHHPVAYAVYDA